MKPQAAKFGMAEYSFARRLPRCASAARSRAARDWAEKPAAGLNSGTAALAKRRIEAPASTASAKAALT